MFVRLCSCIGLVLIVLAFAAPVAAQVPSITATGAAAFKPVTLTGAAVTSSGLAGVPVFTVNNSTGNSGFNVTLQISSLVNGTSVIAASSVTFTANGGTVSRISGTAVDATNGPRETGSSGALDTPLKCVTCNGRVGSTRYGRGRYAWTPSGAGFVLVIPASALNGTYAGTLTATVTSGP